MLGNRLIQVKLIRESDLNESQESQPINYRDLAKVITKSVSTCIVVYVTADTARRVVVYILSAKV
jgi:hypothetical protein